MINSIAQHTLYVLYVRIYIYTQQTNKRKREELREKENPTTKLYRD